MRISLRGRYWTLRRGRPPSNLDGQCDYGSRTIRIAFGCQDPQELLETVIHECWHALQPDLGEEVIAEVSADLTEVLFRLGARVELPR